MDLRCLFMAVGLSIFSADLITAYAERRYKINLRRSAIVFGISYIVSLILIYYILVLFFYMKENMIKNIPLLNTEYLECLDIVQSCFLITWFLICLFGWSEKQKQKQYRWHKYIVIILGIINVVVLFYRLIIYIFITYL